MKNKLAFLFDKQSVDSFPIEDMVVALLHVIEQIDLSDEQRYGTKVFVNAATKPQPPIVLIPSYMGGSPLTRQTAKTQKKDIPSTLDSIRNIKSDRAKHSRLLHLGYKGISDIIDDKGRSNINEALRLTGGIFTNAVNKAVDRACPISASRRLHDLPTYISITQGEKIASHLHRMTLR